MENAHNESRAGLIMVEAALAVIVLAIGVLAAFMLFGSGLDTRSKASADTQAALFADGVFNTLRAECAMASESNCWEGFWNDFTNGAAIVPVAAGGPDGAWADADLAIRANVLCTNVYSNFSFRLNVSTNIVDHALRYCLDVAPQAAAGWTNRIEVKLTVWEGIFGTTNEDEGAVFYTEFDNPGDL